MEHYEPNGFALEIFKKRYALHENETWNQACSRVATYIAMGEKNDLILAYRDKFYNLLVDNEFMPAGRIWYGSGRSKGQLLNCFVVPTEDSREGWGDTVRNMIIICGTGGGLGVNCSPVRPRGSSINGSGGTATGATSLMEIINAAGEVIKAGGGRRTALMMCLDLNHGDIQEFLDKKLNLDKLNNSNISVVFNENPEMFFDKVRRNEEFELKFRSKVIGRVPARTLWKKIISNALKTGEPGVLNGYLANKMSNIWYYKPLIGTNPCGEVWLTGFDCCCLGAIVLPRFIVNGKVNWQKLKDVVAISVRFLDDVLTVNNYPLPDIAETCKNIRRIGLGVTGLHDMLLMLGMKYNSDDSLEFVNKLMDVIKCAAYEASVGLAIEKGSFPKFEAENFLKSGFCKTLKPSIRTLIKENGIRNCALLTIAPTGTTSMVCDVTSGIEPMFAPAYQRKYRSGEELKTEIVIHPLLMSFIKNGKDVSHFQGTYDLSLRDHFEMQRICQKHIDNACSKTINVAPNISEDEISELYMEFFPELKGVTIYADGSREDQPLTPIDIDTAFALSREEMLVETFANTTCKDGKCDL
jgi:ribonucleoside-diphosphate reductase alpha chain